MTINTTAFSGVAAGMACHTGDLPLSLLTGDANGATVYGHYLMKATCPVRRFAIG
jgi:hypothetical protein